MWFSSDRHVYIGAISSAQAYKSGGVVISDGLGISEGLQSRVGLDDLILQSALRILTGARVH